MSTEPSTVMKLKSPLIYVAIVFSIGFYVIGKVASAYVNYGVGGVLAVLLIFLVGVYIMRIIKE